MSMLSALRCLLPGRVCFCREPVAFDTPTLRQHLQASDTVAIELMLGCGSVVVEGWGTDLSKHTLISTLPIHKWLTWAKHCYFYSLFR